MESRCSIREGFTVQCSVSSSQGNRTFILVLVSVTRTCTDNYHLVWRQAKVITAARWPPTQSQGLLAGYRAVVHQDIAEELPQKGRRLGSAVASSDRVTPGEQEYHFFLLLLSLFDSFPLSCFHYSFLVLSFIQFSP